MKFATENIAELGMRLARGSPGLFVRLLREIPMGRPVAPATLAQGLGWYAERLATALAQYQGIEYDLNGHIVGYGLTCARPPTGSKSTTGIFMPGAPWIP